MNAELKAKARDLLEKHFGKANATYCGDDFTGGFHARRDRAALAAVLEALTRPDEVTSARRRDALRRMVALDEEMGLYDDEAVPPSRVTPNMTGSVSERFIEALKFARYYIVEALEVQENSDLRDALVTLDWLIDGDAA